MARLSVELEQFFFVERPIIDGPPPQVTLGEILTLAGERTFGFLFVLLALPSALPIPAPGYSIPFGVVMFVLAVQLGIGRRRPWLPQSWQRQGFALAKVQGVIKAGLPWLQRIEVLSRPRLSYVCTTRPGRMGLGAAIALMAIAMMIPIPGTNTLPAIGIFVTGFGLLDDDGLISLGGIGICLMAVVLVGLILFGGYEGAKFLLQQVFQR